MITTLAVYQTKFWLAIAAQLRSRGLDVAFISFDDLSSDMVAEEEYPLLTLRGSDATRIRGAKASHLDKSGVKNLNLMISHERLAFNINSSEQLHLKFLFYFSEVKVFLESLKKSNDVILFQELGLHKCSQHSTRRGLSLQRKFLLNHHFSKADNFS